MHGIEYAHHHTYSTLKLCAEKEEEMVEEGKRFFNFMALLLYT
jgi:hypothetical protein